MSFKRPVPSADCVNYSELSKMNGTICKFQGRLSQTIRKLLPGQLCSRLPSIVNEQLNGKLGAIPQSIALTQLLQIAGGALGLSRIANKQSVCPD